MASLKLLNVLDRRNTSFEIMLKVSLIVSEWVTQLLQLKLYYRFRKGLEMETVWNQMRVKRTENIVHINKSDIYFMP